MASSSLSPLINAWASATDEPKTPPKVVWSSQVSSQGLSALTKCLAPNLQAKLDKPIGLVSPASDLSNKTMVACFQADGTRPDCRTAHQRSARPCHQRSGNRTKCSAFQLSGPGAFPSIFSARRCKSIPVGCKWMAVMKSPSSGLLTCVNILRNGWWSTTLRVQTSVQFEQASAKTWAGCSAFHRCGTPGLGMLHCWFCTACSRNLTHVLRKCWFSLILQLQCCSLRSLSCCVWSLITSSTFWMANCKLLKWTCSSSLKIRVRECRFISSLRNKSAWPSTSGSFCHWTSRLWRRFNLRKETDSGVIVLLWPRSFLYRRRAWGTTTIFVTHAFFSNVRKQSPSFVKLILQ